MFPTSGTGESESPRDLWGRGAGAPRSLLSLSGSAGVPAGAEAPIRTLPTACPAGNPRAPETVTRTPRSGRGSGPEDLAAEGYREDGTEPFGRRHVERVVVVSGEIRVPTRLQRTLLPVLTAQAGAAHPVELERLEPRQALGGFVVIL